MITKRKVDIYKKFGGDNDLLVRVGSSKEKELIKGNEWSIIDGFIQDLGLINNGLSSEEYQNTVMKRLVNETDNSDTIEALKKLATTNL